MINQYNSINNVLAPDIGGEIVGLLPAVMGPWSVIDCSIGIKLVDLDHEFGKGPHMQLPIIFFSLLRLETDDIVPMRVSHADFH